ncbi:NADPH-dependent 2,4-dienoyl-CoA reductase, sulfur reductase [Clostridium acidisoli DSM 12555]|uniref:NADPH-dependent 2,4-dienoyl-CoA reductase, sulfur reductase n=1 Tax=Clostridium acidisoli DSM 12555 TaxID=1121291 RepID=A0A1W1XWK8_9CLOT|nr:DsrE/DsrF/DrsH-like family protein [Clostridium acidisoli]SMC28224.1 NADPH-dependent 2,4-dienoyl-CoA reductase, sulfur reductase [Clostridium acidisoli DSM 12555]
MKKKIIIVGGVAGGASTAARLRRLDESAEIVMLEKGEYISFANCGLPYYIGEKIKDREKLIVQTPENMMARFNLDIRTNSEAIKVDTVNNTVKIKNKLGETYDETYDYLVLSPGAKPIKPPIPGINSERILTLRNIPDTDKIKKIVASNTIKNAVVIGGGFIGIEMAENLNEQGIDVTLIEAAPHILAPFDSDMSVIAEKEMMDNGVNLILGDAVESFKDELEYTEILLKSGLKIEADLIILSIGVAPDTSFIENSSIELSSKGHIIVDSHMKTNVNNIFALGDAVQLTDFINGEKTVLALAGPANKQGRIVADNICSIDSSFKGAQGTSIIKIFALTAASTGNNERTLTRLGIPYKVIYVHPFAHASYYPAALPLSLKLIFNGDGKILGAQSIGYDGVDKRIDVIASVIRLGGTVHDLTELELSYAPPFSSAKDPVNMAGFTAENVLNGLSDVITPSELVIYDMTDVILVDVRSEIEFANGHLEGAMNLPVDNLRENLSSLDKNKEIIVYCQVGIRGYIAERILRQNGFKSKNLTGGYKTMSMLNFKPKNNSAALSEVATTTLTQSDPKNFDDVLDACGLCCPGPLMQVKASIDTMSDGKILKVNATDPGFYEDIKAWCSKTNNTLVNLERAGANITAYIKKGKVKSDISEINSSLPMRDNKTMVVFSGDLDKAIASFIIANGAASMGKKVTMFFTFWGLNILRKPESVPVKKDFIGKMFGIMMPRGSKKLKLSKMNMMGMGAKMIRMVMKNNNVSSLEDLIKAAVDSGIEIVACQMSMDVMGIKKEELIDGVKIGGVGYYLGEAEDANVNLFI